MIYSNINKHNKSSGIRTKNAVFPECNRIDLGLQPFYGISFVRQPVPVKCWSLINAFTVENGFAAQDYYTFPMNLPSRCVYNRTCEVTSRTLRFKSAAGLNSYSSSYCQIHYSL